MNTKQRKQVITWVLGGVFLTVSGMYNNEILANWEALFLPVFIVMMVLSLAASSKGSHKRYQLLNEIVLKYPILKTWFVLYVIALSIFIYDSLTIGRNLDNYMGGNWIAIAIIGLIFPAVIALERDRYIRNGD